METDRFEPLVMKMSEESDELAEEICTVLNIQKTLQNEQSNIISNILGYGMLVLDNFDESGESKLLAYYVMPLSQMTLS